MKRLAAVLCMVLGVAVASPAFYGEALCWRPTSDGFDFAVQNDPGVARTNTLRSDYDWGVRFGAIWADRDCCFAGEAYGLYIRFQDSADANSGALFLPFGNTTQQAQVRATREVNYWSAGVRARRYLHSDECIAFYLTAGARFTEVNEWREARGNFPTETQETLKFRGAGPEVGVGGSWRVWRQLDLLGSIYVAPIIGERKSRLFTVNNMSTSARTLFPNSTVVAPMVDARLALRYGMSMWRTYLGLEVGYELDHYWNALIPAFGFLATNQPAQARRPEDIGFAGPYLKFSLRF